MIVTTFWRSVNKLFGEKKCQKTFTSRNKRDRPRERCGTDAHNVICEDCGCSFARTDAFIQHRKKQHPPQVNVFKCHCCEKSFEYELALHLHQERCGKERPKPFRCTVCDKTKTRQGTLDDHCRNFHSPQAGGSLETKRQKRKAEESAAKKKVKLPDKVDDISEPDKIKTTLKGAKTDVFFYPKTSVQEKDQTVFFKETFPRLRKKLGKEIADKKAVKWNLLYTCKMMMASKYQKQTISTLHYFRLPYPLVSTYPQQLNEQL